MAMLCCASGMSSKFANSLTRKTISMRSSMPDVNLSTERHTADNTASDSCSCILHTSCLANLWYDGLTRMLQHAPPRPIHYRFRIQPWRFVLVVSYPDLRRMAHSSAWIKPTSDNGLQRTICYPSRYAVARNEITFDFASGRRSKKRCASCCVNFAFK